MKALVGAFNQEKALVGAFSVIVKTGCGTDGALHSTRIYDVQARSLALVRLQSGRGCHLSNQGAGPRGVVTSHHLARHRQEGWRRNFTECDVRGRHFYAFISIKTLLHMVGIACNNEKGLLGIFKLTAKLCCHLYKTA